MLKNQHFRGFLAFDFRNQIAEKMYYKMDFFVTLKKGRIYRRSYGTMEEVRADMFQYIELFYNRKRLHSTLGYMTLWDI